MTLLSNACVICRLIAHLLRFFFELRIPACGIENTFFSARRHRKSIGQPKYCRLQQNGMPQKLVWCNGATEFLRQRLVLAFTPALRYNPNNLFSFDNDGQTHEFQEDIDKHLHRRMYSGTAFRSNI
jgi:hypothetical protein